MSRIFLTLSLIAIALMLANLAVGLSLGDVNQTTLRLYHARREVRQLESLARPDSQRLDAARSEAQEAEVAFGAIQGGVRLHRLLGLGACLISILVSSITITYFVGTSRWCREVGEAYSLDPQLYQQSTWLKRRTFPWAGLGITATLVIASLGAASDPTANHIEQAGGWVSYHFLAAVIGTGLVAFAFVRQALAVGKNYGIIQQILTEVRSIRAAKGLD